MLGELLNIMEDKELKEQQLKERLENFDVTNIVNELKLYADDPKSLTDIYTKIFMDENVVKIVTKISQQPIFLEHFPELYAKNPNGESVINCQQNTPYHRYGVFKHTLFAMECVGTNEMKLSLNEMKLLKWTMLLHDIGKPVVKFTSDKGRDSFAGHEEAGVPIAKEVLDRFDFTEREKKIILTLIRYHDEFLNEGELTWENLSFLAHELEDKKQLFDFLIEVKLADNKAKTIDVYDKFLAVLPKYRSFEKEYFNVSDEKIESENQELDEDLITGNTSNIYIVDETIINQNDDEALNYYLKKQENLNVQISNEKFDQIYNNVVDALNIRFFYQPIINMKSKKLMGYQMFIDVSNSDEIPLDVIIKKAQEQYKFDKINNHIMVRYLDKIQEMQSKFENKIIFMFPANFKSYTAYNNKNKVCDIAEKYRTGIIFKDYVLRDVSDINSVINKLYNSNAIIVLDNLEISNLSQSEIDKLQVTMLKYNTDGNITEELAQKLTELAVICGNTKKQLLVSGIDTKEAYEKIKTCGVHLIQGEYISGILANPNYIENQEL